MCLFFRFWFGWIIWVPHQELNKTFNACSFDICVVVQLLSHVQFFSTPWTAACQASLSFAISWSLLKLMSIESVMPSNHLFLCCPLLSCLQSFSASRCFLISWLFASGGLSIGLSASVSVEYSGLIFFRIDWLDLLAVQGTLKSLLQHHSSKASILWHSAFFMIQLSHPYMVTGKTVALTIGTFVGKKLSLLFNMVCRFVIAFFPRSKYLSISWLQSPFAVFGA